MPDSTTEQFAHLAETIAPLVDMVAGYRAQLEAAGYSPTMAEAMSAQLHGTLLVRILGGDQ